MARGEPPFRFKCRDTFTRVEREQWDLEDDEGYQCTGRCTRPIRAAQFRRPSVQGRVEYAILHPSPKPGYRWQVTWFDEDGPWGDTEVRNCNQGLEAILDQWIGVVRDESGAVVPGFEVEDWD